MTGEEIISKYNIETLAFDLETSTKMIWVMLATYDVDEGTEFRIKYTKAKIKKILLNNLPEDSHDFISYENLNKAKTAFGKLFDVGGSFLYFKNRAKRPCFFYYAPSAGQVQNS